jgi:hypothetical protein
VEGMGRKEMMQGRNRIGERMMVEEVCLSGIR